MARILGAGFPAGPNVVLTVRGRTTGMPRTFPIAMLDWRGRRFVQASFGEVAWVGNLRAAGSATVRQGGRSTTFRVVELPSADAASVMRDCLAHYHRMAGLGRLIGPEIRPPVAVLHYFHLRIDASMDDYVAEARRHPLFELLPVA